MKKVTVTFSIPEELNRQLHSAVGRRGLSQFVSEAIQLALDEEQNALRNAYKSANSDRDRSSIVDDWAVLDGEDWDG